MKVILLALVLVGSCWAFGAPAQTYIADSREARANQFPYMAHLQRYATINWVHFCGASIVSPNWVITAAHCTQETNLARFRVQAGVRINDELTSNRQIHAVTEFTSHPSYNKRTGANDIALVRLATSFVWTNAVQPIALPSRLAVIGSEGTLSGWGATSSGGMNAYYLRYATLPISSNSACRNGVLEEGITYDALTQLCSVSTIQACRADEGSPLEQNGVLVGVVSGAYEACSSPTLPTLYARVPSYVSWINGHISA